MPFDAEELAYIAALDARADCEVLARELPALRPECGRTLQVSTALLQAAAAAGLRCPAPQRSPATTPRHSHADARWFWRGSGTRSLMLVHSHASHETRATGTASMSANRQCPLRWQHARSIDQSMFNNVVGR